MKTLLAVLAATIATLMLLPENAAAQAPQKPSTFIIANHAGQAQLLQLNGKSYVEVETLARLTKGTLSFSANQTILTLPLSESEAKESAPPAKAGFSIAFIQAGIEEMSLIREWRVAIVNAVQNNNPVPQEWVSAHHRSADKSLALASAAASTDDDRSAIPLLAAEFNNMLKLSDLYLAMRAQNSAISPDNFGNSSLEQQILSCAHDFVTMTESHEFQDLPVCR
jgi:hypothetical protein